MDTINNLFIKIKLWIYNFLKIKKENNINNIEKIITDNLVNAKDKLEKEIINITLEKDLAHFKLDVINSIKDKIPSVTSTEIKK